MTLPENAKRDWLTIRETAGELGMNQRTLYTWVSRGRVKTIAISGGRHLVHRNEINRIKKEGR